MALAMRRLAKCFFSSKSGISSSSSSSSISVGKDSGGSSSSTAARLTIAIKTAIRDFRLGDIPNARVCGLPTERSLITVIRGPHIDKKSREQFDIQTRKWRVTMDTETSKLREKLDFLKEHRIPGVEIKAKFQYKTRLAWPLKPISLSNSEKWKLYTLRHEQPDLFTPSELARKFGIDEEQVYHILRSVEEQKKHLDMFQETTRSDDPAVE